MAVEVGREVAKISSVTLVKNSHKDGKKERKREKEKEEKTMEKSKNIL